MSQMTQTSQLRLKKVRKSDTFLAIFFVFGFVLCKVLLIYSTKYIIHHNTILILILLSKNDDILIQAL